MSRIELLAPAGDLFRGKIGLEYGADAVYFGTKQYSLRARASNFSIEDAAKMIEFAHTHHKKAYLVVNILCHNVHLTNLVDFIKEVDMLHPDGYIVADPAVVSVILSINPKAIIHISTQQSVTNSKAAMFWKRNGASRIILSRELSYSELKLLSHNVHHLIELEMFIHGAVCIAYSGRCMLSNNFCRRDANIGGCAQSCRWLYKISTDKKKYRPYFSMSAKDMCLLPELFKLMQLDITSFKIEGRMKTEHYLATVCKVYRTYLDQANQKNHNSLGNKLKKELNLVANRDTELAWLNGCPTTKAMIRSEKPKQVTQNYAFIVNKKINNQTFEILSKNYFTIENNFEWMTKSDKNINFRITSIINDKDESLKIVNVPNALYTIKINKKIPTSGIYDMIRIKK